jgi:Xaa-Pro aminopeptidase
MTQSQPFFDWTDLPFPTAEFAQRRQRLVVQLRQQDGGIFLAPARHGFSDGFTFRQLDDFLYFTGLELPDSMLAIEADSGEAVLFVPEEDGRFFNPARPNDFPGRPLLTDPLLAEKSGIGQIRPFSHLTPYLQQQHNPIWLNPGHPRPLAPLTSDFLHRWNPVEGLIFHLQQQFPQLQLRNGYAIMAQLRMVKSAAEIGVMRRVCAMTCESLRETAVSIRPGIDERTLEGILEASFKKRGAQQLPFASIIKSGPNTLWPWRILAAHYNRRNRVMQAGELVVFDVGCELDGYVSDMGRTFPVSGRFSPQQKDVLAMQLAVLEGMITAVKPGRTLADIQAVANALIPLAAKPHMQVGPFFGHHIGLSAGDPMLLEAPLAPGMIITIEPWYYNHSSGIATFLEDVVLVTETGFENLTAALGKTAVLLEELLVT